jgi:hypothetical protein
LELREEEKEMGSRYIYTATILLIIFIYSTGCAKRPNVIQKLKDNSIGKYEFNTKENYQYVYQTILGKSRECWQSSASGGVQTVAYGDLYLEFKSAYVTIGVYSPSSNQILGSTTHQIFGAFDITSMKDNSTKVEAYWNKPGWDKAAYLAERWVEEKYNGCE